MLRQQRRADHVHALANLRELSAGEVTTAVLAEDPLRRFQDV